MKNNKGGYMLHFKLKQIEHENETWKRVLDFMTDENIRLKNRLSEILKGNIDNNLLKKAEDFQNNFVRTDDLIRFLRNDIATFDKLLTREIIGDGDRFGELTKKVKSIRANIGNAEKQFNKLKLEFNNYLLEHTYSGEIGS